MTNPRKQGRVERDLLLPKASSVAVRAVFGSSIYALSTDTLVKRGKPLARTHRKLRLA